jgi:hypothetical protein
MERVWAARLRWRLRGGWLGPLLVVLTVADGLLLHARPLAGEGTDVFGGMLLGSFFDLVAVAVVAPFAAMALRRRRPDLPALIARERAAAVLVLGVSAGLLIGGALHHGTVVRDRKALADAQARAQAWIGTHAPREFRAHVALANTVAIVEGHLFRTCVPSVDGTRAWCAIVRTDVPFPRGVRPAGGEPNSLFQRGRE